MPEPLPIDKFLYTDRKLRSLLFPLIFEQMLFIGVGLADTIMIAWLGEESVSGVSFVDMVNSLLAQFVMALATGGAVVTSQHLGGRRFQEAQDSARHLLLVALALGTFLACVIFFSYQGILRLLLRAAEEGVQREAATYFHITLFTYPFLAVYAACTALFRSMNRSDITFYCAGMMNLLNLAGNYLLMFVFHYGVAGAAYSTLFARAVTMTMLLLILNRQRKLVPTTLFQRFSVKWQVIHRILFIGIPSGVENVLFQLGRVLLVSLVARFGTYQMAANATANTIDSLNVVVANAFCLGMITVAGQSVGTGSAATFRYYVKKMMKWTYASHAVWSLLMLALFPLLFGYCFGKISPEARHLAMILCLLHNLLGILMWPMSFTFPNALRSANDVKFTMTVSILSMIICRIGVACLFAYVFQIGVLGVWIGMIVDWILRISLFYWRYRSNRWVALAGVR